MGFSGDFQEDKFPGVDLLLMIKLPGSRTGLSVIKCHKGPAPRYPLRWTVQRGPVLQMGRWFGAVRGGRPCSQGAGGSRL